LADVSSRTVKEKADRLDDLKAMIHSTKEEAWI
jgi:hypothetical protein